MPSYFFLLSISCYGVGQRPTSSILGNIGGGGRVLLETLQFDQSMKKENKQKQTKLWHFIKTFKERSLLP